MCNTAPTILLLRCGVSTAREQRLVMAYSSDSHFAAPVLPSFCTHTPCIIHPFWWQVLVTALNAMNSVLVPGKS